MLGYCFPDVTWSGKMNFIFQLCHWDLHSSLEDSWVHAHHLGMVVLLFFFFTWKIWDSTFCYCGTPSPRDPEHFCVHHCKLWIRCNHTHFCPLASGRLSMQQATAYLLFCAFVYVRCALSIPLCVYVCLFVYGGYWVFLGGNWPWAPFLFCSILRSLVLGKFEKLPWLHIEEFILKNTHNVGSVRNIC